MPEGNYQECGRPENEHMVPFGHPWKGPASEGGSNTPCHREECRELRLAKVHQGFGVEHLPMVIHHTTGMSAKEYYESTQSQHFYETPDGVPHLMGPPPAREPSFSDLIPAVQAWDAFSAQVRDTIVRKSEGYGNAWQRQGWLGNLARILSKTARLDNMLWREKPWMDTGGEEAAEEQESVLETAVDLGALCAFFVSNVEAGNRWGR
jgi:hypothetical protein